MSDPVPDTGILATGPAFLGKPDAGVGAAKSLTNAEALTLIAAAWATAPTTEPVASGVPWRNNGALTLSVGIPPAFTLQPSSQTINEGQTATFSITATNAASYQWQKQEGGTGSWTNISGATSTSYTTGTLTNAADNADTYRCVATGAGGTTNSSTATLTVLPPAPLTGLTAQIAISPIYLVPAWQAAAQPTVRVERGWASGVFQDLFPHSDGRLYTQANGAGQTATAFAAGSRLFVHVPYNQTLANKDASGHPSAISDSRRLLLDLTFDTSPSFAGLSQGTQDSNQHATERGYDTNVSVTSNSGLAWWALDNTVGSADHLSFQNNGGSALNVLSNPGNFRWYDNAIAVVNRYSSPTLPSLKCMYVARLSATPTTHSIVGSTGAFRQGSGVVTTTATATPIRVWGPTSSLAGRAYAFVMASPGALSASLAAQVGRRLHGAAENAFGAAELQLCGPKTGQGFPIDLNTSQGNISIEVATGPGRVIEAQFNGGAWVSIGTTDASGYLSGTLAAAAGKGSLAVRCQGQATAATVTNISVGVFVATLGQSNAVGRGDDFTMVTAGSTVGEDWINRNAGSTSKSWTAKFGDNLAVTKSAPLILGNFGTGASYLYFDSGGSTDGRHGNWAWNNPGSITSNAFATAMRSGCIWYGNANFTIWHQGESEGADVTITEAKYKTSLINMWTEWKARTGQTGKLWVMQIGRNGTASDAATDTVRRALANVVSDRPDLFEFGGCLAHLPVEGPLDTNQNVHFFTLAQKNAVVAVFQRHALGAGRGPRYSSGSKGTTTATLTFTGGVGDIVVGGNPIGWTCTDGSGALTVSNVAASGKVITLTFNRSISGSLLIKWLSHYSGIGTTIADSDATTPVPPEPFEVTL